jgi:hypothetical protein
MSISGLVNVAAPTLPTPSQPISAASTRILALSNFSPQIKTKDLHQAFQPWAEDKGGYKIKWIDDVTALAVFNDATVGAYSASFMTRIYADPPHSALLAKKAYLSLILNPPTGLPYPAMIRPYDGPDSTAIIQSVNARSHGHANRASISQNNANPQVTGQPHRGSFGQSTAIPFQVPGSTSSQPIYGQGNGMKHGRSSSLSSTYERPNFSSSSGTSTGASAAFNKLGGGGAFSAFGSGSSTGTHGRHASVSSNSGSTGGSWGRQTAMGGFALPAASSSNTLPPRAHSSGQGTGFNPSRLPTHHEMDSPQTTPVKPQHQPAHSISSTHGDGPHPLLHLPHGNTHPDLSSPGIDILGAVGPEGGPGGIAVLP